MRVRRLSLGVVDVGAADSSDLPAIRSDTGHLADLCDAHHYAEFKYGSGAVAAVYGTSLASLLVEADDDVLNEDVVRVTSSAYKVAPPASHALSAPFRGALEGIAWRRGLATRFESFKIDRGAITEGDYATFDLASREDVMRARQLTIDPSVSLRGKQVVVLDDIHVTGSHEAAVRAALEPMEPAGVFFLYVLRVPAGARNPGVESCLNGFQHGSIDRLVQLANDPGFIPNARVCKFLLSQRQPDIERLCDELPRHALELIGAYVEGDGLDAMSSYLSGSLWFFEATRARGLAAGSTRPLPAQVPTGS